MASAEYLFSDRIRGPHDVVAINERIRDEMEFGKTKQDLIALKKKSDLLCAYVFSRETEGALGDAVEGVQRTAMTENSKTAERGNEVGGRKGWDVRFTVWGTSTYGPRYKPAELVEPHPDESNAAPPGQTTPGT